MEKSALMEGWKRDHELQEEMSATPVIAEKDKGEGLDYEEPDEDEVECTTDLKKKKMAETAEVKVSRLCHSYLTNRSLTPFLGHPKRIRRR